MKRPCPPSSTLVDSLQSSSPEHRFKALVALQFVWGPIAAEAVVTHALRRGGAEQKLALQILERRASEMEHPERLVPLLLHSTPATAVSALACLEAIGPNVDRMQAFMRTPARILDKPELLTRYYAPALTPPTLRLLGIAPAPLIPELLVALIHQNADAPEIRAKIRALLAHGCIPVRDRVAEYLTWHGQAEDRAALTAARLKAGDMHERAFIEAVIAAIDRRGQAQTRPWLPPTGDPGPYRDIVVSITNALRCFEPRRG